MSTILLVGFFWACWTIPTQIRPCRIPIHNPPGTINVPNIPRFIFSRTTLLLTAVCGSWWKIFTKTDVRNGAIWFGFTGWRLLFFILMLNYDRMGSWACISCTYMSYNELRQVNSLQLRTTQLLQCCNLLCKLRRRSSSRVYNRPCLQHISVSVQEYLGPWGYIQAWEWLLVVPLLPVMDYFIQTCNWSALLMDSSHCYGKVTLLPFLGPLLILLKTMVPLCKIPLNHPTWMQYKCQCGTSHTLSRKENGMSFYQNTWIKGCISKSVESNGKHDGCGSHL